MLEDILITILWSVSPIFELRGGIPYAIASGLPPHIGIAAAILGNILIIPIVYFFLDYFHIHFMKLKHYRLFFRKYIEKNRVRIEKKLGTKYEFLALVLLVGIPLPFTGAYSGTLLSWFFGVNRKTAYKALILGILIAATITALIAIPTIANLKLLY